MSKTNLSCLLVAAVALLSSCASSSTVRPDQVKVTRNPTDVSGCVDMGDINGLPSSPVSRDMIREAQVQAAGAGGNVVVIDSRNRARTYRCEPYSSPKLGPG